MTIETLTATQSRSITKQNAIDSGSVSEEINSHVENNNCDLEQNGYKSSCSSEDQHIMYVIKYMY